MNPIYWEGPNTFNIVNVLTDLTDLDSRCVSDRLHNF